MSANTKVCGRKGRGREEVPKQSPPVSRGERTGLPLCHPWRSPGEQSPTCSLGRPPQRSRRLRVKEAETLRGQEAPAVVVQHWED